MFSGKTVTAAELLVKDTKSSYNNLVKIASLIFHPTRERRERVGGLGRKAILTTGGDIEKNERERG